MKPARARLLLPLLSALVVARAAYAETPVRITDIQAGPSSSLSSLRNAAVLADKLYFGATDDGSNYDLWVYDGISSASIVPGGVGLEPEYLTEWEGALYFLGGPFADRELWRYDGVNPPAEELDLFAAGSGNPEHLIVFGPELCFNALTSEAVGDELVCWDGTNAPTVYDLRTGTAGSSFEKPAVIGDTLYFDAFGDGVGSEPWAYEGFSPPTLVGDLEPGTASSNPESFVGVGTTVYFRAGNRVWSADGVAPPAILSPTFTVQGGLASWHGRLLVDGHDDVAGGQNQLHVLRAGSLVQAQWPGGSIFGAGDFLDHRNALYFHSGTSVTAGDLFRYSGCGGVERVTDLFADTSYVGGGLVLFQSRIYFFAFDDTYGGELWAVDPQPALLCTGFEIGDDDWSTSLP